MVQGRGVDSSLNELGREQARLFYESYKGFKFNKVYTSSLKRTVQSVQQFITDGLLYEQLPGLDEISWGTHEGQPYDELRHGKYLEGLQKWNDGDLGHKVGDGESPIEVAERQKEAMDYILSQSEESNVLIATHGRAMRILLCWLMKKPLTETDDFLHSNLCLYHLKFEGSNCEIVKANDTVHLDSLGT